MNVVHRILLFGLVGLLGKAVLGVSPASQELLTMLSTQAQTPFSAEAGRALWYKEVNGRSCPSCHMDTVLVSGRHAKTGKVIEPMAPSVNATRLTDMKKMRKWLKRNCKWTFGRECTAQEQGDVLTWLIKQ